MSDNIFPTPSKGPVVNDSEDPLYSNADYKPVLSNWFTSKPYGFRFLPKVGEETVMFLPIGPSNLTITTHFATTIVPTIYGTVEEHSPVRYFDIVIEGTTGMGPKYTVPMSPSETASLNNGTQQAGRSSFSVHTSLSTAAAGFFAKTLSVVDKVVSGVSDQIGRSAKSGLLLDQTGYAAFHNLYRFFLKYKKDVSGTNTSDGSIDTTTRDEDRRHPLVFFNYKDNNEYNVVVKSFVLRRDKENPMLYMYSIVLRGYNLKEIGASDRLGSNKDMLASLGLDGIKGSVFLAEAKKRALGARDILNSVANGINQLGR
jgi:hypothetical protein